MSYADDFTEEKLLELEKKINKVYSEAQKDLEKQAKDYFEQFAKRDEEYKKLVDSGEITKDEYKQWRLNQIGRGERINKMAANMAERATQANEVAMAYVNDATPTIYSLNRNHEAYVIEQLGHDMTVGGDFTLYNESSVRRMLVNEPEVMPYYPEEKAVARGIDLEYGQKVIKAKTTSGILQGKSVYKIADDLQRDITNMNRVSAVRAARTAITSAQNGGRQDTMLAAQKMGIKLRKRWVSAKDGRVRDAHGAADGQTVNVDEPFIVGGEKLMFPGDKTSASGWNLYNCRCGMRTVEKEGIEAEQRQVRIQNPKYTEAAENEEKAKAKYERAKAKEDAETDPEKKKALRKDRLEKQKEYERYSSIRKGTQKNIVVNGDMTYKEWAKLRGIKPKKAKAKTAVQEKPKFISAKTKAEAEAFAKSLGVNADYSKYDISVANAINETMQEYVDIFGEHAFDNLDEISMFSKGEKLHEWGGYSSKGKSIKIRGVGSKDAIEKFGKTMQKYAEGYFSTGSNLHIIRHELGHAVHDVVEGAVSSELKNYRKSVGTSIFGDVSFRAGQDEYEFVAECLAQYLDGNPSKIAVDVVEILKKEGFKYKFG